MHSAVPYSIMQDIDALPRKLAAVSHLPRALSDLQLLYYDSAPTHWERGLLGSDRSRLEHMMAVISSCVGVWWWWWRRFFFGPSRSVTGGGGSVIH